MAKLTITRGKTFALKLRPASLPYIYKAITAITKTGPVSITCPSHGMQTGWRAVVVSVKGMTQINAAAFKKTSEFIKQAHKVTVVDANTITINTINSSDFPAYSGGGYIQYLTPTDLTGSTARMAIKDKVGGLELLRLDTTNGRVALDNTQKTVSLTIEAAATTALTWATAKYDCELVGAPVAAGAFVVGLTYKILTLGTTNFTLIGALSNTVNLTFTATGAGTGTGAVEGTVSLLLPLDDIKAKDEVTT